MGSIDLLAERLKFSSNADACINGKIRSLLEACLKLQPYRQDYNDVTNAITGTKATYISLDS